MIETSTQKIVCPHCGYEYLPVEVFIPKTVFDIPYIIYRDDNGSITNAVCEDKVQTETYQCDKCNNFFKTKISIEYSVKK